ncbi:MAG: hypothetical protein LC104_11615 [Bacteroidales bacterium]|nr:hypothetical protein [Bacteroidales bacterium]
MSCRFVWSYPLAVALALVAFAHPASAQTDDPFALVRGLRENGMADLAMDYLKEKVEPLAAKNPALKEQLLLERAKTLLESADQAEDENIRTALLAEARTGFDTFLKGSPSPEQAAEAAVAVARVITLQAQAQLGRSAKAADDAAEKAEALKARPMFEEAAKRLDLAITQLENVLKSSKLSIAQDRSLKNELMQTYLNRAITRLKTADTFVNPNAKEVGLRGKLIDEAMAQFKELIVKFKGTSAEYVARAWLGQCEVLKQAKSSYQKTFSDLARIRTPTADAGQRLARYFEAKVLYDEQKYPEAKKAMTAWLRQYGRGRPTAETYATRYYYYLMQFGDVLKTLPKDPKDPEKIRYPLVPAANSALREIERGFRRITQSDNDYSEKANKLRMRVVRFIVGDAEKKPAAITDFDECVMTALVKFQSSLEASGEEREKKFHTVVALLERALELPAPADSLRDIRDTKLRLVSAYLLAGQPYPAAVLGESMARNAGVRGASIGALAGQYAIQAYLAAAAKAPATDEDSKKADQARAISIAKYLHHQFPADPNTDAVRFTLGQLLYRDGVFLTTDPVNDPIGGAFNAYAAVNTASPRGLQARLLEGVAAFEILRPSTDIPAPIKAQVRAKIIADLRAIPKPSLGTNEDDATLYVQTQLLLAQLYLMDYPKGLVDAERTTNRVAMLIGEILPNAERYEAVAGIAATRSAVQKMRFAGFSEDERKRLGYLTEEARLRSVYGQLAPLFAEQKYAQVLARLNPELSKMNASLANDNQGEQLKAAATKLDEFRREKMIVMALQTRIREGNIDAAQGLFEKLKVMGGSLEATINSLTQLLAMVRPQIEELQRKGEEGKPQLDKLIAGISTLLDKVGQEKNLGPREKVFLGKALKDIGSYERAIPILEQVPAPSKPELLMQKNPNAIPNNEDRLSVIFYRGAQLELARAFRLSGNVAEAERVLKDAMGDDAKPGWAKTSPDFRKEALYTLEDKAAGIATAKDAQGVWSEARNGWGKIAGEYQAYLRQPIPKDPQKAAERKRLEPQVKAMYFETFYEYLRCLTRANSSMLKDNPTKLAQSLGKLAEAVHNVDKSNPDLTPEVRALFVDLLEQYPVLKEEYIKVGGKGFLKAENTPPTDPTVAGPGGTN